MKNKEDDIDVRSRFKYTLLLGLNEEELKNYCVGDKIIDDFRRRIFELNADEDFQKMMHEEEKAKAIEWYERGFSLEEIASHTKLSIDELKEILKIN